MYSRIMAVTLVGGLAIALAANAPYAQERRQAQPADQTQPERQDQLRDRAAAKPAEKAEKTVANHVYRMSEITGMTVRNQARENLGNIEDLVIDLKNGEIQYAAVSFGGFLGIGDKLFAVPLKHLQMVREEDDTFFVLNVTKERLEQAPGFDKDDWPNLSDKHWAADVDKFYGGEREKSKEPRDRGTRDRTDRNRNFR